MNCKHCESVIEENDFYTDDKNGDPVCESCEQSAWGYANTVVVYNLSEKQTFKWCDEFGFRDDYWEERNPKAVSGFKYVRTDGWRGYWDVIIADGYKTVAFGWSTGRWDDVPWKHLFNDFCESISEGEVECPFELTFAFGLTSNVFSVSSDIIIKESEMDSFLEWMSAELGYGAEELNNALK